jgi:hypothetical protein
MSFALIVSINFHFNRQIATVFRGGQRELLARRDYLGETSNA